MSENPQAPFYEMSFNVLAAWQAHSLSTAGSNGSNRVMPRRQLLADKSETDACSGNIAKHHHAALVAAYFAAEGNPLCPACRVGDGRLHCSIDPTMGPFLLSASSVNVRCATRTASSSQRKMPTARRAQGHVRRSAKRRSLTSPMPWLFLSATPRPVSCIPAMGPPKRRGKC